MRMRQARPNSHIVAISVSPRQFRRAQTQPALALVIIKVLFLVGGIYVLRDIAENLKGQQLRKDELLAQLAKDCIVQLPKTENK